MFNFPPWSVAHRPFFLFQIFLFYIYKKLIAMDYAIVAMGIFFLCIAFVVTAQNAKYLLSGYNTMSAEERKNVDLKGLISYFRIFFIFLGVSFLLVSLVLLHFVNEISATVFICIYPVIACIYLVIIGQKFYKKILK